MKCPKCGKRTSVIESRPSGAIVVRRRRCPGCHLRFATVELLRDPELVL